MFRSCSVALAFLAALFALFTTAGPAGAHGFTTVVYAHASAPSADVVRMRLGLEYDLLLVSVAEAQKDDPLYRAGQPAWDDGDFPGMVKALQDHRVSLQSYLAERFTLVYAGATCTPTLQTDVSVKMNDQQGVPYANVTVDYRCRSDSDAEAMHEGHIVGSTMFPDSEGFVTGTKTIVTYDIDDRVGSAALDGDHTSFSTRQSWGQRFWEFWRLGAEHLLTGLDHMLFLTALIIGSRRLREIVLAATTFTLAHSTTLILAAFGVVHVSNDLVEPLIALSIAATASWFLWRVWRRGEHATDLDVSGTSHFALDRAGWSRLAVVFCFGLVHGLGFAGALGIDHAWSWPLLWSLLVFNVGIETVQLGLIVLVFPLLMVLRRYHPRVALVVTAGVAVVVTVVGLIWFGQRVFGFQILGEGG
ncbi:HupE/UreJ family protein [Nocardioides sp. Iso805N]|uniref:HupE/UreJ family protein n=1 Tax=Nocardioides sp. Iso805N TaxID=1283287 RepID=UPI00035C323E|nr:HupE/UreJ family protein [Nocardioides sp. Iso805N]